MNGETVQRGKMSILFGIVLAVILLAASFLVGYTVGTGKLVSVVGPGAECSDSELLAKLTQTGYLPPEFDTTVPVNSLNGKIVGSGSDYIEVEAALLPIDEPKVYRVQADAETVITTRQAKSREDFAYDLANYNEAMESFDPMGDELPPEPPSDYEDIDAPLSNLRIGMIVQVNTDTNVRGATAFIASDIRVTDIPTAVPTEPPTEETDEMVPNQPIMAPEVEPVE